MLRKYMITYIVGFISLTATLVVSAAPVSVDMTSGIWTITGSDIAGNNWSGSTINFETQVADNNDWLLSGYFEWVCGNCSAFGRENFTGTLFEDRTMHMEGNEIVQPASGIIPGIYDAELALSNNDIVNGEWGGPVGIPSNMWTASRAAVPIPAAVWLFGSGLLGLIGIAKKKAA